VRARKAIVHGKTLEGATNWLTDHQVITHSIPCLYHLVPNSVHGYVVVCNACLFVIRTGRRGYRPAIHGS
jgi:hypothetical protein